MNFKEKVKWLLRTPKLEEKSEFPKSSYKRFGSSPLDELVNVYPHPKDFC